MDIKKARQRFDAQRRRAATRGIEWRFTFEQWLGWWGDDLDRRGPCRWQLGMQRLADRGAYEIGNVRKGRPADNAKTRAAMHVKPSAVTRKRKNGRWHLVHDDEPNLGYASAWDLYG